MNNSIELEDITNFFLAKRELRPDSTPAKFFARNCLCEIQMVAHK